MPHLIAIGQYLWEVKIYEKRGKKYENYKIQRRKIKVFKKKERRKIYSEKVLGDEMLPYREQCCVSGSGRIHTFFPDPDTNFSS